MIAEEEINKETITVLITDQIIDLIMGLDQTTGQTIDQTTDQAIDLITDQDPTMVLDQTTGLDQITGQLIHPLIN